MKRFIIAGVVLVLTSAPSWAQTERGYVNGAGGFAVSPDTTSGQIAAEAGVRVAPHLFVFGELGQFHNLQPSGVQPAVDSTTAMLSDSSGLNVLGTGRVPASYGLGGVRVEVPSRSRISPYAIGGIGFARLSPTAQFTYSSGPVPDGTTPAVGDDVTSQIVSAGYFTQPAASNAFMFTLGGGVDVPVARHWAVDTGYRFSRVQADVPVNTQGMTFGFGYRF